MLVVAMPFPFFPLPRPVIFGNVGALSRSAPKFWAREHVCERVGGLLAIRDPRCGASRRATNTPPFPAVDIRSSQLSAFPSAPSAPTFATSNESPDTASSHAEKLRTAASRLPAVPCVAGRVVCWSGFADMSRSADRARPPTGVPRRSTDRHGGSIPRRPSYSPRPAHASLSVDFDSPLGSGREIATLCLFVRLSWGY